MAKTASITPRKAIIEAALLAAALVSLSYAVLTTPKVGIDLAFFQQGARRSAYPA